MIYLQMLTFVSNLSFTLFQAKFQKVGTEISTVEKAEMKEHLETFKVVRKLVLLITIF